MEQLLKLLKTDGEKAQAFITNALARSFVDISDGAIDAEYHGEFEKIEIYIYTKKRGQ